MDSRKNVDLEAEADARILYSTKTLAMRIRKIYRLATLALLFKYTAVGGSIATDFQNCSIWVQAQDEKEQFCEKDFFKCERNPGTQLWIKPPHPLLTLRGCENFCGNSFQIWDLQDNISRFILWLFPVFIVIAHFQYPPLGHLNTIAVVLALISNPIGSLWSMLTRREVYRRSFQRIRDVSVQNDANLDIAKDVTIVVAACDHYSYFSPLQAWLQTIQNRHPLVGERLDLVRVLDPEEQRIFAQAAQEIVSNSHETQRGTLFAILGLVASLAGAFIRQWANRDKTWLPHTVANVALTFHFIALIQISGSMGVFTSVLGPLHALRRLQQELRVHRDTLQQRQPSPPPFHLQLNIGGIQTDIESPSAQEGEDIPLMLAHDMQVTESPPAREGEQISPTPADDVQETESPSAREGEQISPAPADNVQITESSLAQGGDQIPPVPEDNMRARPTNTYRVTHAFLKMNSTWRPQKSSGIRRAGGSWRPLLYAVGFVTCSYATAFYLSFSTVTRVGFGCRCLSWTLVYVTWILSAILDYLFGLNIGDHRKIWRWTVCKDAIISFLVIGTIFIHHIGLTNTCRCHAGSLFGQPTINVWPPSDQDWRRSWILWPVGAAVGLLLEVLGLIALQTREGFGPSLLCPTPRRRDEIVERLQAGFGNVNSVHESARRRSVSPDGRTTEDSSMHLQGNAAPMGTN